MKKSVKRVLSILLLLTMLLGVLPMNVFASDNSDEEYDWQGKWIWTSDTPSIGQWVNLRKTFTLNEVPSSVEARISIDSRYWMWINGEMAVYEGQLKGGPDKNSWYYDAVDIASYLKEGENTIAILACYWGYNSGSTTSTGNPGLIFDAVFPSGALTGGATRLISDNTWRVQKDPAYETAPERKNKRPDSPDVKYNANKAKEGWEQTGFDDSSWTFATVKTLSATDPRKTLVERSIPQWKVGEEVVKYDASSLQVKSVTEFGRLSLPSTYTVTAEVKSLSSSAIGVAVCVNESDKGSFYMPQIQGWNKNIKPHKCTNGSFNTNITLQDANPTKVSLSSKMTVTIEVTNTTITTYVNGTKAGTYTDASLPRAGYSVGFRAAGSEELAVYSMKVTDSTGNLLWEDGISEAKAGDEITDFKKINGEDPELREDADGTTYMRVKGTVYAGEQTVKPGADKIYSFYNRTNIQGAPYLKVRSTTGGETIHITSDATTHEGGEAVSHYYVTKAGEQEWEAFSWTNGYRIDFRMPASVEVIELGWRESSYNTEHTGHVNTDNTLMNQLYQEAYDTLLVTMRDIYMDCPDRERTQWWGDAVLEMQQAAYAMDEDARYLYKKLLTQAIGWTRDFDGSLSGYPTNVSHSEFSTQCLAGVHSLWQYYLYYGETDILETCYPAFLDFLKLWQITDTGFLYHRGGTSSWIDWCGNVDASISDHCWYYIAAVNLKNVAELLDKPQADIDFLEGRIDLIKDNFDTMFWDEEKGAYYSAVSNGKPDDRAQAMAVYSGLADPVRYPNLLQILKTTKNSSPYNEKYVLEALYMMGYAEEAIERTLDRYGVMLEDDHPTLWEDFSSSKLDGNGEGKTATRNHAWSGGPLSLMYMYNAGITSTGAGFETFRVRPQLGSLNNITAKTETIYGLIEVSATKNSLGVTVPTGTTAEICVPRLDGATTISLGGVVVYDNGKVTENLPEGIYYTGEDTDYVKFTVPAGEYTFTMAEDTADAGSSHSFIVSSYGNGTVKVNGVTVNGTYTYEGAGEVNVTMTPADGSRVAQTAGSFNEIIYSENVVSRTVTLNGDATLYVMFDEPLDQKHNITITDLSKDTSTTSSLKGMFYAYRVYVNGKEVFIRNYVREDMLSIPYMATVEDGETVTVEVRPVDERNYDVYLGDEKGQLSNKMTITMTSDIKLNIVVSEKSNVKKIKIQSMTSNSELPSSSSLHTAAGYDGSRVSNWQKASAYSSKGYSSNTPDEPITLTLDLGSIQRINQVSLFPRNDFEAIAGGSRCFPKDFTISVSDNDKNYATVYTVTDAENPNMKQQTYNFDDIEARYVKITVTKLGEPDLVTQYQTKYRLQFAEIEVARIISIPVINNNPTNPNKGNTDNTTTQEPDNTEETQPVETPAETTPDVVDDTPDKKKKGCGSSIGCGITAVLVSAAAACCIRKKSNGKKKDD